MLDSLGFRVNSIAPEAQEILDGLDSLKRMENPNTLFESYEKYLDQFGVLLKNEYCCKNIDTRIICEKFLSFPFFVISDSFSIINKLFPILAKSQKNCFKLVSSNNMTPLFIRVCGFALQEKDILNKSLVFFEPYFANPEFSFDYFDNQIPHQFFVNLIPDRDILKWGLNLVVDLPNPSAYKNVDFFNLFSTFRNAIIIGSPEFSDILLVSFSVLFNKISIANLDNRDAITETFIENDGLSLVLDDKFSNEIVFEIFFLNLISSSSSFYLVSGNRIYQNFYNNEEHPNGIVLKEMKDTICKEFPDKQKLVFSLLKRYKHFDQINGVFPLIHFFTDLIQPTPDLLDFVNECITEKYDVILPRIFTILFNTICSQMIDDFSIFKRLIGLIFRLVNDSKTHIFNMKEFIKEKPKKFLQTFILTPSSSTLSQVLDDEKFMELCSDVFSYPQSKEIQPLVFSALLEVGEKHMETCACFLKKAPTKGNMTCLMKFIEINRNFSCFSILLSAFITNEEIPEKFIECDGLVFAEKCFQKGILSLDLYSMLLASLVNFRQFKALDKFITRLASIPYFKSDINDGIYKEKDLNKNNNLDEKNIHPLFSLNQRQLEMIVYGMNKAKYRPMKVPSLYYFLISNQDKSTQNEYINKLDPYNSYILGRYAIKMFLNQGLDIYKIPFIVDIANRYLLPKHVELLMQAPKNFDIFCDSQNYDHFSLFQLYPSTKPLVFDFSKTNISNNFTESFSALNINNNNDNGFNCFKSISFWIKFKTDDGNSESNISFFQTENVSLRRYKTDIILKIGSKETVISINDLVSKGKDESNDVFKSRTKQNSNWIHFFVSTENKKNNNTYVAINGNIISSSSTKSSSFSIAKFLNNGMSLLFIGTSIRFFTFDANSQLHTNLAQKLFKSGTRFISPLSNEMIITPFNIHQKYKNKHNSKSLINNLSNINVRKEIPSSCYAVPYFGFPFHFISFKRLSDLFNLLNNIEKRNCGFGNESENEAKKTFNSIFDALLSINSIIDTNTDRFCRKLVNSFKLSKKFISKNTILKALRSISGGKPSSYILKSILFDHEMWKIVDVKLLLEVLFDDYFKSIDLNKVQDFELFLTTIVRKHPKEQGIVDILLENITKLPNLNRYLMDTLYYRKKNLDVQLMIVESYIQLLPKTNQILTNFDFDLFLLNNAEKMILITDNHLAVKLFFLMTKILIKKKNNLNDVQYNNSNNPKASFSLNILIYVVMKLSSFHSIWSNVFELVNNFGVNYLCLLLSLVWSRTFANILIKSSLLTQNISNSSLATQSNDKDNRFYDPQHEGEYITALELLNERICLILKDENCMFIINNFFPILLNIPKFLEEIAKTKHGIISNIIDSIKEGYNLTNIRDFDIKIKNTISFMFSSSFSNISSNTNSLFILYFNLLKNIPSNDAKIFKNLFLSLIIGKPFDDDLLYQYYVPEFYLKILIYFNKSLYESGNIKLLNSSRADIFPCQNIFLSYLLYFLSKKLFSTSQESAIITFIFSLCEKNVKIHEICNSILIQIINSNFENNSFLAKVLAVLKANINTFVNVITNSRCEIPWFYILSSKGKELFNEMKDLSIWPQSSKTILLSKKFDDYFRNFIQSLSNTLNSLNLDYQNNVENYCTNYYYLLDDFSEEVNKNIQESQIKSDKARSNFQNEKKSLYSSFFVIEEKMQWSHFVSTLNDQMSDVNQFKPKFYHLSPKSFPYICPQKLTPSPFCFNDEREKKLEINDDNHGKKNENNTDTTTFHFEKILELFNKYTKNHSGIVNINLFLKSVNISTVHNSKENQDDFPAVQKIIDCQIIRYSIVIPSVMFIYQSEILFLTYAELVSADTIRLIDIDDKSKKFYPIFIESVLLGHWGSTSIFSGHVILKTINSQVIFIRKIHRKLLYFWSFKQGHFIVKMEPKKLIQVENNILNISLQSQTMLPNYPFLFKLTNVDQAYKKMMKNDISIDDMLLVVNGLYGKSFVSLKFYPYFPFNFEAWSNNSTFCSQFLKQPNNSHHIRPAKNQVIQKITNYIRNPNFTSAFLSKEFPFQYFALMNDIEEQNKSQKSFCDSPFHKIVIDKDDDTEDSYDSTNTSNILSEESREEIHLSSSLTNLDQSHQVDLNNEINKRVGKPDNEPFSYTSKLSSPLAESLMMNEENSIIASEFPNKHKNKVLKNTPSIDDIIKESKSTLKVSFYEANDKQNDFSNNPNLKSNIRRRFSDSQQQNQQTNLLSQSKITKPMNYYSIKNKINRIKNEFSFYFAQRNNLNKISKNTNHHNHNICCPANFYYSTKFVNNDCEQLHEIIRKHRDLLEKAENLNYILDWISYDLSFYFPISKTTNIKINFINSGKFKNICNFDQQHVYQPLRKSLKPSKTFIFYGNTIRRTKRLTQRLNSYYLNTSININDNNDSFDVSSVSQQQYIQIDRKALALSILELPSETLTILEHDRFFAFTKSLNVSENGVFMCIDFEFGITRVYRIVYTIVGSIGKKRVKNLELVSDFSWKYSPISEIDGIHWICATAAMNQLCLWEIYGGTINHLIDMKEKINTISVDENFGVWCVTQKMVCFISFNGEIISKREISSFLVPKKRDEDNEEITVINSIQLHSSYGDREAVCGTSFGKVFILLLRFDTNTIDTKELLKNGSKKEIKQIIFHPNKKCFVTSDSRNDCAVWTAQKLGGCPLQMKLFDNCALCSHRPEKQCQSCNRAICKDCCIKGLCLFCVSSDIY